MAKVVATIDGIHGVIKIVVTDDKEEHVTDLKWCVFDGEGLTGFMTSFMESPVILTEVAAEHFIRMTINSLAQAFELSLQDLTILNHMGERLPDVQFLPPTFEGNEADISHFITAQDNLRKLHAVYEESGVLDVGLLNMAETEGITSDFLSLVHLRTSGVFLVVRNQVNRKK